MNPIERTATFSIATLFAVRLLGLFMVLPILSLYANNLSGATPTLIGLALGGYGITQALFQIPCGMLSDRYNRKRIIIAGLLIFIFGSIIAALSTSILQMIIGRILQGAGAIGSVTLALLADLTREEQRTKAMAGVGITIGASFSLAMILGPLLSQWIGVTGIFWLSAGLGFCCIAILLWWVPESQSIPVSTESFFKQFRHTLYLAPLNIGVFILHTILTAIFVVLPLLLKEYSYYIYFPIIVTACLAILPFLKLSQNKTYQLSLSLFAILLLACSFILLWFSYIIMGLILFFMAFTFLEGSLPALVTTLAPSDLKGTAMGIYSCSQFLGMFIGGLSGGWIYGHYSASSVLIFCAMLAIIWFFTMRYSYYGKRN